jgi:hypothetical protein
MERISLVHAALFRVACLHTPAPWSTALILNKAVSTKMKNKIFRIRVYDYFKVISDVFSAILSAPELCVFAPSDFEARVVRLFAQEAWVRVDQFLLKLSKSFQDSFLPY